MAKRNSPPKPFLLTKRAAELRAEKLALENEELRAKLGEAEETLRAIHSGDVDAVVVTGPEGDQVFTLKGAEYAYRALVEAMSEGAATISADGIVLYSNGCIAPMLQLQKEQVIGHPVNPLIAKADQNTFAAMLADAIAGKAGKAEIHLQVQDGTVAPAYVSLSPLRVNDASAACMVVTDLREHKKREELIAAGNLARAILENAAEAIAVCDQNGRIILGNEALRRLCGCNPLLQLFDELLPLEVVTGHSNGEPETQPFSVAMAMGGDLLRGVEVTLHRHGDRRRDGRITWLLLTAGPLAGTDQVVGCVLTLTDVTKRKMAEKALLRAEKLAATGQLAATIAHEINNPLAAVFNLLYLIEKETDPETARKHANDAIKEIARVSHITKQALAFYRDSTRPENLKLSEVLDDIVGLFKKELQARKTTVEKNFEIAGEVHGYPGEIRQVFSNLIRNSIEAVPEGGHIRLHIRHSRHAGNDGAAVFISDNGSGIKPGARSLIFEPFFTTKGKKGTGLGLWVAKDLVQKHGGMIRVRCSASPSRMGTCFYVFIPSAAAKDQIRATAGVE